MMILLFSPLFSMFRWGTGAGDGGGGVTPTLAYFIPTFRARRR